MTEFTPTVTIELKKYMYLEKAYEEYEKRFDEIQSRICASDPALAEDLRDDGLFDII